MTIGWYVHHHGRGHATRARCVLPHLHDAVTVLTSAIGDWDVPVVRLPSDVPRGGSDRPRPTPRGRLHHAPVDVPQVTDRTHSIVRWLSGARPELVVIDVSVELTLLTRLSGIRPVVVRMHGDRTDAAHLTGFDAAASLLALYPRSIEDPSTPQWVRDRTTYVGGFSRYDHRHPRDHETPPSIGDGPTVVALSGTGGTGLDTVAIGRAAEATPKWTWHVLGEGDLRDVPRNVVHAGWVEDVYAYLVAADVVVGSAGHNTVMEVAAARRPLVCVPEERPFHEQEHKARALADAGLATVRFDWPAPSEWPELLEETRVRDTSCWREVVDGDGARRAAHHLGAMTAS